MADVEGISGERLLAFLERIERLEEEKAQTASLIADVYAEAKADGFQAKIVRQLVRLRKMDKDERDEQETLLELYRRAVGMDE